MLMLSARSGAHGDRELVVTAERSSGAAVPSRPRDGVSLVPEASPCCCAAPWAPGQPAVSGISKSVAVAFPRNWSRSSTRQNACVAIKKQKCHGKSCSSHCRCTVLLCFFPRRIWAILCVALCGFIIRKLMQLKINLCFLLDGVSAHEGTETPHVNTRRAQDHPS